MTLSRNVFLLSSCVSDANIKSQRRHIALDSFVCEIVFFDFSLDAVCFTVFFFEIIKTESLSMSVCFCQER